MLSQLCLLKPVKSSLTSLGYQKNLTPLLNRKKAAEGDRQALILVQREIKRQILVDKEAHTQSVEKTLSSRNSRVAWQGVKQADVLKLFRLEPSASHVCIWVSILYTVSLQGATIGRHEELLLDLLEGLRSLTERHDQWFKAIM